MITSRTFDEKPLKNRVEFPKFGVTNFDVTKKVGGDKNLKSLVLFLISPNGRISTNQSRLQM